MSNIPSETEAQDMMLSAMVDGELSAAEADQACARWRGDALVRRKWHDYQLIGDVLRSEDLARSAAHDCGLVGKLRAQLANEPVVLAPENAERHHARSDRRSRDPRELRASHPGWAWGAVAAGVLAVSTTWIMTQESSDRVFNTLADRGPNPPVAVAASAAGAQGTDPIVPVAANNSSVPDSKLDPYLAAHRQFSSGTFAGTPSGSVRQVSTEVSGR